MELSCCTQELVIKKSEPGANDDEGFVAFTYRSSMKVPEGEDPTKVQNLWESELGEDA
jgi:hypothetical protein